MMAARQPVRVGDVPGSQIDDDLLTIRVTYRDIGGESGVNGGCRKSGNRQPLCDTVGRRRMASAGVSPMVDQGADHEATGEQHTELQMELGGTA